MAAFSQYVLIVAPAPNPGLGPGINLTRSFLKTPNKRGDCRHVGERDGGECQAKAQHMAMGIVEARQQRLTIKRSDSSRGSCQRQNIAAQADGNNAACGYSSYAGLNKRR